MTHGKRIVEERYARVGLDRRAAQRATIDEMADFIEAARAAEIPGDTHININFQSLDEGGRSAGSIEARVQITVDGD